MPKPPRRTMPIRWPLKLVSNWFELPRRMSKLRVRAQLLRRRRDEILGARWTQPRLRPRGSLCCSRPALPTGKGQTLLHGSAPPLKTPSIARHRMKECDEAGAPALAVSDWSTLASSKTWKQKSVRQPKLRRRHKSGWPQPDSQHESRPSLDPLWAHDVASLIQFVCVCVRSLEQLVRYRKEFKNIAKHSM